ncbi:MAG TPA: hypothetical protein VNK96_03690 [Fimbriimonadales bacterium]|nr:hypothetical protein [Fimbriimonadales bacterium]
MPLSSIEIEAYDLAQEGVILVKRAIRRVFQAHPEGLRNSVIGRLLGVNADFLEDQQGWFQYTVLKIMERERTVEQVKPRGSWRLMRMDIDK